MNRAYDGKWVQRSGGLGIQIGESTSIVFPFAKVKKWLASGATGDSLVAFFRATPRLIKMMNERSKTDDTDDE